MSKFNYVKREVCHVGDNGVIQRFVSFDIHPHINSNTWTGSYSSEWLLKKGNKLFVSLDQDGSCLVDYHSDYHNETLPLEPFSELQICANEKDLQLAVDVAQFCKELISSEFNVDVSDIPIVNVG